MKKVVLTGLCVALVLIVSSCASTPKSQMELTETSWAVSYYLDNNELISSDFSKGASVVFGKDGSFGGTSGFNSFMGSYAQGENGSLKIEINALTKMLPPPEAEVYEEALIALFNQTVQFSVNGDMLELHNANGKTLVSLTKL